jgi:uncharacterized protein (DUF697 family)
MSAAIATNIGIYLDTTQAQGNLGDVNATAAQALNSTIAIWKLLASYTGESVTFTTDGVDLGAGGILAADVTTANGASYGTVTPVCQTSKDGSTWVPAMVVDSQCASYATAITGSFGAIASDTTVRRKLAVDRYVRFVLTIAGGATADIAISGQIRKN